MIIESSKRPDILDEVNLLPDHHSSGAIIGTRATNTGLQLLFAYNQCCQLKTGANRRVDRMNRSPYSKWPW